MFSANPSLRVYHIRDKQRRHENYYQKYNNYKDRVGYDVKYFTIKKLYIDVYIVFYNRPSIVCLAVGRSVGPLLL
jgi:hypothetical protein